MLNIILNRCEIDSYILPQFRRKWFFITLYIYCLCKQTINWNNEHPLNFEGVLLCSLTEYLSMLFLPLLISFCCSPFEFVQVISCFFTCQFRAYPHHLCSMYHMIPVNCLSIVFSNSPFWNNSSLHCLTSKLDIKLALGTTFKTNWCWLFVSKCTKKEKKNNQNHNLMPAAKMHTKKCNTRSEWIFEWI